MMNDLCRRSGMIREFPSTRMSQLIRVSAFIKRWRITDWTARVGRVVSGNALRKERGCLWACWGQSGCARWDGTKGGIPVVIELPAAAGGQGVRNQGWGSVGTCSSQWRLTPRQTLPWLVSRAWVRKACWPLGPNARPLGSVWLLVLEWWFHGYSPSRIGGPLPSSSDVIVDRATNSPSGVSWGSGGLSPWSRPRGGTTCLRDGEGLSPRIPQTVRKRTEAKSKQQLEEVTTGGTPA